MGYTTSFFGRIQISPPLNEAEVAYLKRFASTRRMKFREGPYFVDQPGDGGQDDGPNVIDINEPSEGQPGLWCHWVPVEDGTALTWDGGEKFREAEAWMRYVIDHFLRPGAKVASPVPPLRPHPSGLGKLLSLFRSRPAAEQVTPVWPDPQFAAFTFDHHCNGIIVASGEEYPDLWRIDVQDNVVTARYYELPGELSDNPEEGELRWDDVIFALESEPEEAIDKLDAFLEALPPDHPDRLGLAPFLRDLAGVLPPAQQEALTQLLDRRGMRA